MNARAIAIVAIWLAASTIGISPARAQTPALLLFGGTDHKTFLGCLNCSEFDSSSVCNEFGNFGSEFSGESIWNEFGTYGSEYSALSPWNEYTSTPPVIVDRQGNFYGYFTANEFHVNTTRIVAFQQLFSVTKQIQNRGEVRKLFCKR
jgi:hypothetical protein